MSDQLKIYNKFKAKGFPVVVRTPGEPGTWNDDTGVYDGKTDPVDDDTFGLKKKRDIKDSDGTLIQAGMTILVIPAYGLPAIDNNHQILIDDVVQEVANTVVVDPQNIPLVYEVQLA